MKKLSLWKNKWFAGLLVVQLCLVLVFAGIMIFRRNAVYTCTAEEFTAAENGNLYSSSLILPRGIYKVELLYECDGNMQNFADMTEIGERGFLLSSGEHLSSGLGYTGFDLWIKARTEARLEITRGGDTLRLLKLNVYQTDKDMARAILLAIFFSLLMDALFILRTYYRQYGMEKYPGMEGYPVKIPLGLIFTILLASVPLFVGYVYPGSDITYHLLRIDNLKDGLLSGQFPVRIDPTWLWGHGYASSICYGETLLYIPALLRLLGFTLQGSYHILLFLLNVGTCLTAYFSFKGIFRSSGLGLFCSMLYTLSIYRLFKMYSWGALGEAQAMLWLPLIFYAVYRLLADDTEKEGYGRKWIPLAIGFSGIIQCHVLTCELTVIFLAVICVIFWKRLCRKQTFLAFVKAVLGTCALSAWFVVPFLDYMLNTDMVIHHVSARTIQEEGLYPANLLLAFFHRGFSRDLETNGMRDMEALGVGITMTAAAGIMLFLWFWGYLKDRKEEKALIKGGKTAVVLGIAGMLMSLAIFPWDRIQSWNAVTAALISSIQYPNRFLMLTTLFLTFSAGVAVICIGGSFGQKATRLTGMSFIAAGAVTALFYISSIVTDAGSLYMYDVKGMGTGYLSGGEYLRYGADTSMYSYSGPRTPDGVEVIEYNKEWLDIDLTVCNNSDEGYVDLPLQHYKGYTARTDTGEKLQICDGDNLDVRVLLPEGFAGDIQVRFQSPWYWRLAEIISLFSVAALMILGLYFYKNKKQMREAADA